jgi:hypothetical protein
LTFYFGRFPGSPALLAHENNVDLVIATCPARPKAASKSEMPTSWRGGLGAVNDVIGVDPLRLRLQFASFWIFPHIIRLANHSVALPDAHLRFWRDVLHEFHGERTVEFWAVSYGRAVISVCGTIATTGKNEENEEYEAHRILRFTELSSEAERKRREPDAP